MTHEPLDPLREKMIAALYGELSAEEEREFEALLSKDAALRGEWEELQEARTFLRTADERLAGREAVPSFAFVAPPDEAGGRTNTTGGVSFWERLRGALRTPVPALALATCALVILIVAGLRVDRTDAGLVLRFGPPVGPVSVAPTASLPGGVPGGERGSTTGTPIEPGSAVLTADAQRGADEFGTVAGIPVSNLGGYMTRAEFAAYAREMNDLVESMLDDQEDRRRAELAYVIRGLYEEMSGRNQEQYDVLNAQIQEVWMGLAGLGAQSGLGERQTTPEQGSRFGVRPVQQRSPQGDE